MPSRLFRPALLLSVLALSACQWPTWFQSEPEVPAAPPAPPPPMTAEPASAAQAVSVVMPRRFESGNSVLILRPDYLYVLAEGDVSELGRWRELDKDELVLEGGHDARRYRLTREDALLREDAEGKPLAATPLLRVDYRPLDTPLTLTGRYRWHADAGEFQDCASGKRFPVLPGSGHHALEQAYLERHRDDSTWIVATVTGGLVERQRENGSRGEMLDILSLEKLRAEAGCPAAARLPATLVGSDWYWPSNDQRARPSLHLSPDGRASGSTGCNRFMGSYRRDGEQLRFTALATTRMACLAPDNPEASVVAALNATASFHLEGERLLLKDAEGKVLVSLSREPATD